MSKGVERRLPEQRKPTERTLCRLLELAKEYADELGYPRGDEIDGLCLCIVRRAAEVALLFAKENAARHVHYSCAAGVAKAILADAGLEVENE